MIRRDLIALVLESAIGAELALFAVFLLSNPRRRSPALYQLAGLTICLTLMMASNLLISAAGWLWLSDLVLFLDLLAPPLIYLYVREMRYPAASLRPLDFCHTAPAIIGVLVWEAGLLPSMDLYVNACWFGYLGATGYYFLAHYMSYAPRPRQNFLIMLMVVLLVVGLLRIVIVLQATNATSFREGTPYLLILGVLFLVTCQILFTALRHPDLLSIPGSNVKYALSAANEAELDRLERRLAEVLAEKRPYLNPDFALAELAAMLGAPARHVSQVINARYGMNFSAYMNFWRTKTASSLLASAPDKPVKAVMYESGFKSKSIFNQEFQRHFGLSPSEFRRREAQAE